MGRRSASETIAQIFQAFLRRRTWRQSELAEAVGVTVPALRKTLVELERSGMQIDRDEEPPHVVWTVPNAWFPGGAFVDSKTAVAVVRELRRLPKTTARSRLIDRFLESVAPAEPARRSGAFLVTPSVADQEATYLELVEDARAHGVALHATYYSAHAGAVSQRHLSVHRIVPAAPARFVATCHRSNELRWFRVDGIVRAELDRPERIHVETVDAIDRFISESADAFHESAATAEHVYFVRDPEARWVERNLFPPMRADRVSEGIRVHARTAGALRIARFVVGLGAAARVESEALHQLVLELARGALEHAAETKSPKKAARRGDVMRKRAVTSIRSRE